MFDFAKIVILFENTKFYTRKLPLNKFYSAENQLFHLKHDDLSEFFCTFAA
jgi:hypothetical protein